MKTFLALVLLLFSGGTAWADDYYCLLFSYDSKVPIPYNCHVWGTFVRVDAAGKLAEEVTVSWEPDKVSYIDRTRPGKHVGLRDTLEFAVRKKRVVRMWGPFETGEVFFERAKAHQKAEGRYKFFDCRTRKKKAQNCIHRLSDIAGHHKTGVYWGWWAAGSVHQHYRRQGVIRDCPNDKAVGLLGIDKYTIKRMSP